MSEAWTKISESSAFTERPQQQGFVTGERGQASSSGEFYVEDEEKSSERSGPIWPDDASGNREPFPPGGRQVSLAPHAEARGLFNDFVLPREGAMGPR